MNKKNLSLRDSLALKYIKLIGKSEHIARNEFPVNGTNLDLSDKAYEFADRMMAQSKGDDVKGPVTDESGRVVCWMTAKEFSVLQAQAHKLTKQTS